MEIFPKDVGIFSIRNALTMSKLGGLFPLAVTTEMESK